MQLSLKQSIQLALAPETPRIHLDSEESAAAVLKVREAKAATSLLAEGSVSGRGLRVSLRALGVEIPQFSQFISSIQFPQTVGPFTVLDSRIRATKSLINRAAAKRVLAAQNGIDEARSATQEVREQIAGETARAYLETVRASEVVELEEDEIELSRLFVSFASERKANGLGAESDIRRSVMELNSNGRRLSNARMEQARSVIRLLYLLNLDFSQTVELTDRIIPAAREITLEDALGAAQRMNPSLRTEQVHAMNLQLSDDAARASWLPTLSVSGDFGPLGVIPGPAGASSLTKAFTWSAGLEAKIPVLDGHRRELEHANILLQMREEEIRKRDLWRKVELNVRLAFAGLTGSKQQLDLVMENAHAADLDLAEARASYSAGNSSGLELRETQVRRARAEDARVEAVYQHTLARLTLAEAIGSVSSLDW